MIYDVSSFRNIITKYYTEVFILPFNYKQSLPPLWRVKV